MANEVDITVNSRRGSDAGFSGAERRGEGFKSKLGGIGKVAGGLLAAGFAGAAAGRVLGFFSDATGAAADLGESLSKSNTIFGNQAKSIERWAGAADRNIGLAKGQALDAAAGFGNLFTQLGIGSKDAADMSTSMVELAGDFASFHNADITEVLQAQSAAFRGEYDSVQRFVPTINAARVEQQALNMTGKATKDQLTDQDKALAVNALMFKGAGKARGDFARTSSSAANQERVAAAAMENTNAMIGQKMLPVSMALTQVKLRLATVLAGQVLPAFMALGKWVGQNKTLLLAIGIGIAAVLVPAFIAWAVAAGVAAAATIAATFPLILIGAAVAAVAFLVIKNWAKIKSFTAAVWPAIQRMVSAVWNWIKRNWPLLLSILTGPIGAAVIFIIRNWAKVKAAAGATVSGVISFFSRLPGRIISFVASIPGRVRSIFAGAGRWLWNAGANIIGGLINGITSRIGALIGTISGAVGRIRNMLPFSPAKEGPLSGKGDPYLAGQRISERIGAGIASRKTGIGDALGGAMQGAGSPRGAAGGGGVVRLEIRSGGSRLDDLLVHVLREAIRGRGGDVQGVLGS